jgi:hypothetical protein
MVRVRRVRPAVREVIRILTGLALVLVGAIVTLSGLDALPDLLSGHNPGIEAYESIEGGQRALGERFLVPAFFPDTLNWPPTAVRVHPAPPKSVALVFAGRDGEPDRLIIFEAFGPRTSIPMALTPSGLVLHRVDVPMTEGECVLYRVQVGDGSTRNDLVWMRPDATVALRYAGSADELITIARSLYRSHR